MIATERHGIMYTPLGAEDLDDAARLIAQSFTDGSEPAARALRVGRENFTQFIYALLPKFLDERLSIVARDEQSGKMCGG
jgi:hypothetical protein